MRKFGLILAAFAGTAMAAPAFADEGPADVNYDCALYNECDNASEEDAGDVRGGFTMRRNGEGAPAVRSSDNVRGGFTMRRQPLVEGQAKPAQATTAGRARIAPRRESVQIAKPKPVATPGKMVQAQIKAGQQITFVSGSAELQPGAKLVAQKLAIAMLRPDKVGERFRIEGHTDAVGTRELNVELSERRALAVVAYLASQGVDSKRLEVAGYGFDQPLAGQSKFAPANRRVVAKVIN
jgi:outer membrane protein OmpA-like peptidoglycan-associated protein